MSFAMSRSTASTRRAGSRPGHPRRSPRFGRLRIRWKIAPSSCSYSASRERPRSPGCASATARVCDRAPAGGPLGGRQLRQSDRPGSGDPSALNDRAADNWRPLLAIADTAGGEWPKRAREAACVLSGEGHDSAENVNLLADIRDAFGDAEVMRSVDLVAELANDPERPWVEWSHGKPLTQKQLGVLLKSFQIKSVTVSPRWRRPREGLHARPIRPPLGDVFRWSKRCNPRNQLSEACKRGSVCAAGTTGSFSKRAKCHSARFEKPFRPTLPTTSDACTLRKPKSGTKAHLATNPAPSGGVPKPAAEFGVESHPGAENDQWRSPSGA